MNKCQYKRIDGDSKGGFRYRCRHCGHRRVSRHIAEHLHRRCRMLAPDRRPDIRQIVLKQLDSWVQRGGLKRSIGEIEARLDRCLADCKHFNGAVCTFRGSPCRLWQRWLETLALGNCLRWQNADEEH